MAELITMPKLGFDMAEGVFEEWAKSVGDEIHEGDVLAIIETDKASVEVTSFQTGVLRKTLVGPGDIVPVGDPIAVLGTADEAIDLAALGVGEAAPAAGAKEEAKAEAEPSPAPATAAPAAAAAAPAPAPEGRLLASPVAMRMAAELGIELRNVQGSGPDGRIIKRDIEANKLPAKIVST
ncbi:MAG: biotin/lipoyl-containing protein, partial [Anaerolineae bacterium]